MPRISSNSFAVNSSLQQEIELSGVATGVTVPISSSGDLGVDLLKVGGATFDLGQESKAGSIPVTLATDEDAINTNIQSVSGISLDFGQELMAASLPVVIASDQSSVAVTPPTGNNATLSTIQEVGIFGNDGSTYRRVNVSSAGNLKVESELEEHKGTFGNFSNGQSVVSGDNSTSVSVTNATLLTIMGNTTDTANGIVIQVSPDGGSNYYDMDFEIFPKSTGDFVHVLADICVENIRLKYQGSATVTATLLFNNH